MFHNYVVVQPDWDTMHPTEHHLSLGLLEKTPDLLFLNGQEVMLEIGTESSVDTLSPGTGKSELGTVVTVFSAVSVVPLGSTEKTFFASSNKRVSFWYSCENSLKMPGKSRKSLIASGVSFCGTGASSGLSGVATPSHC